MIQESDRNGFLKNPLHRLKVFWQFTRPHTIIGSFCSITALYILGCKSASVAIEDHLHLYLHTLIAALACNVFIVGLNQWVDVSLDKINKPWLPLAAGTLSRKNALIIIYSALVICLAVSLFTAVFLFLIMLTILLIGTAYSLPPLQLKRHHLPAALAITLVRGVIVNVGIFLHFQKALSGGNTIPSFIWNLTLFIIAFSVAIAWFKDIPDTEGDTRFKVKTLAVLYSRKLALRGGIFMVGAAYIYVILQGILKQGENYRFLVTAHTILFLLFLLNYIFVRLDDPASIKKFYLRFWVFFFAEYIMFTVWAIR
jgi:homogentisate phytyltransferase / homogentisate geranylgeranyltransferase